MRTPLRGGTADLLRATRGVLAATGALVDLAVPVSCGGCTAPGTPWCPDCARELDRAAAYPRLVAGPAGTACAPEGFVVAAAPYAGVLRHAVAAFKDGERRDLASVLAPPLRAAIVTAVALAADRAPLSEDILAVVPAPSSRRSRRVRGDVPTHVLARQALAGVEVLIGRPCAWAPVLRHARAVSDQARLTRAERAANTERAYVSTDAGSLCGRDVLVVDDVVTSGATARECVRALRAAEARPIAVAALASTPRHAATAGAPDRADMYS